MTRVEIDADKLTNSMTDLERAKAALALSEKQRSENEQAMASSKTELDANIAASAGRTLSNSQLPHEVRERSRLAAIVFANSVVSYRASEARARADQDKIDALTREVERDLDVLVSACQSPV